MTSDVGQHPRVVVDTDVIVSGVIVPHGMPNRLLRLWQQGHISLITSPALIHEVGRILHKPSIRRKYQVTEEDIAELVGSLQEAEQASPSGPMPFQSRDPKDDIFLAVALSSAADYLVTGDEDLLILNGIPELGALQIVTVRTFLTDFPVFPP